MRAGRLVCAAVALMLLSLGWSADFYATGANGTTFVKIDSATGAITTIGEFGYTSTFAGEFTSDGTFWTLTEFGKNLARVNTGTGAATVVGPTGIQKSLANLAAGPGDVLYSMDYDGILYAVDFSTGAFSAMFDTPVEMAMDMDFDSSGTLWVVGSDKLWSVNVATGVAQMISSLSVPSVMGLAIDAGGKFIVTDWSATPALYELNPQTGVTTMIGTISVAHVHGGDFAPALVRSASRLTVPTPNLYVGRSTTMYANLRETGSLAPIQGALVSFYFDGSAIGSATTDENGKAKLTFLVPEGTVVGPHRLQARYAGDLFHFPASVGKDVPVYKGPVKVRLSPKTASPGQTIYLTAKLTNASGQPLVGRTISFKVQGVLVGTALTNANGVAARRFTAPSTPGTYEVLAEFAGDAGHTSGSGAGTLTVG
ncbi:MAG TPA: Ig-like domain repeat protein [Fimbriimonas sp.]